MHKAEQSLNGAPMGEAGPSTPDNRPKRLLLIEDEAATRLVLLQKFRTAGFDVEVAPNGRLALEKLSSGQPDAIFMDLLLPHLKGADVIKAARRHPGFGNRPIYVCTSASRMSAWTRRGTKAGATKVFDRGSTPIDAIVAEVALDLMGPGPGAPPPEARSAAKAESDPPREEPTPPPALAGEPSRPGPPVAQDDPSQPSADKSPKKPFSILQRVVKSFGLARTGQTEESSGAVASRTATPAAQEPIVPNPATGDAASKQALPDAVSPPVEPGSPSSETGIRLPGDLNAPVAGDRVAVLTLDEASTILTVNETCTAMFGWDVPSLIGQNLKLLLTANFAHDLGKLVQQHQQTGDRSQGPSSLRVVARRRDGTEFQAFITTMTWCSDTTLTRRSEVRQFSWTAFIRDLDGGAASPGQGTPALEAGPQTPAASSAPRAEAVCEPQPSPEVLQKVNAELQSELQDIRAEAAKHLEELPKRAKERDELAGRILVSETELHRTRTELQQESEHRRQLEEKLADLTALKADLEKQAAEQRQREEELRKSSSQIRDQLEAAKAEAGRAEAACQEEVARAGGFKDELATLRQGYDELNRQLAAEKLAAAESTRRAEELEGRLRDSAAEFEKVKAELEKQNTERGRLEAGWREKLDQADALTNKLEAACQEEAGRNKAFEERLRILGENLKREQIERTRRFDEEIAGLRQARDELAERLAGEQRAAAESARRAEEFESRLRDGAAEVERVRAELEKQTAEHARLESEWRQKLNTAEALTNKLEAAWVEAEACNNRFEEELGGLRQIRDELNGKLAVERRVAAESMRRNDELALRVIENASELERVRAELEKAGRNAHFEERLTCLEEVRENLTGELRTEQQATEASRQHSEELEKRLRENTTELARVKAEADRHAEEQARLESELKAQLDAAQAAAKQAEQALKEKVAQCSQFEAELAGLRRARDEVDAKLTAEQRSSAESRRRNEELECRMRDNAAELERLKASAGKQAEEQARLEAELRAQLHAAKAATEQAESAIRHEPAPSQNFEEWARSFGDGLRREQRESAERFERDLASLRQVRDELAGKLAAEQQAAAESSKRGEELDHRLRETTSELERVQGELARHTQARASLESDLHAQLRAARTATEKAEAAALEEAERSRRAEAASAGLRKERDELHEKLAAEQQAAAESRRHGGELEQRLRETAGQLERVQAEIAAQAEKRGCLQSELHAQVSAAKTAAEQTVTALAEKTSLCLRLEEEAARLRQEREELNRKLAAEQESAAAFRRRGDELESRLRESAGELESLKAAQARQAEEQSRLEAELMGLRRERDELHGKCAAEQQAVGEATRHKAELADRLRETSGQLERVQAELDRQTKQREDLESDLRAQLGGAKAEAEQTQTALAEQAALCHRLEEEAARLRQEREDLKGQLAAEQQAVAEVRRRGDEFENRLRESVAEMESLKAGRIEQAEEQNRLEAERRDQLNQAQTATALAQEALTQRDARCRQLEMEIVNLRNERHQIYDRFRVEHQAAAKSTRRIKELEKRGREKASALRQATAKLEKKAAEHRRVQTEWRRQAKKAHAVAEQELARLREEREELSRKLTAEQQAAAESRRGTEEIENRLREELKQHGQASEQRVAELVQQLREREDAVTRVRVDLERERASRQAAEEQLSVTGEMNAELRNHLALLEEAKKVFAREQTKLVEALLENARLLQTRLEESGLLKADNPRAGKEGQPSPDGSRPPGLVADQTTGDVQP